LRIPSTSGCLPWAEKPGQRYRMVSFSGLSCEHSRTRLKLAFMLPTVGMMLRGETSMSTKAFTKREASSFMGLMPPMLG